MPSPIDCDVISCTWSERVRQGDDVWRSLFLASFMDLLCHVRNKIMYVLLWPTVYVLTRALFWCLFPSLLRNSGNKHQNNPLVSALIVHHASTYIILYLSLDPVFEIACWTEARDWQKQHRFGKATVYAGPKVRQSILVFGNYHFSFKVPNCSIIWIFIVPMCSV